MLEANVVSRLRDYVDNIIEEFRADHNKVAWRKEFVALESEYFAGFEPPNSEVSSDSRNFPGGKPPQPVYFITLFRPLNAPFLLPALGGHCPFGQPESGSCTQLRPFSIQRTPTNNQSNALHVVISPGQSILQYIIL